VEKTIVKIEFQHHKPLESSSLHLDKIINDLITVTLEIKEIARQHWQLTVIGQL